MKKAEGGRMQIPKIPSTHLILLNSIRNPHIWMMTLIAFYYNNLYVYIIVIAQCVISELVITAIFCNHNEIMARDAINAIGELKKHFQLKRINLDVKLINILYPETRIFGNANVDFLIIKVTAKSKSTRPFSQLKAYPQPAHLVSPIFIGSEISKLSNTQKFFLVHEIVHTIIAGNYLSLDKHLSLVRLSRIYFPLFLIFPNVLILSVYIFHWLYDRNKDFFEADIDFHTWRLLSYWLDGPNLRNAAKGVSKALELKIKHSKSVKNDFVFRKKIADSFCENATYIGIARKLGSRYIPGKHNVFQRNSHFHIFLLLIAVCFSIVFYPFIHDQTVLIPLALWSIGVIVFWLFCLRKSYASTLNEILYKLSKSKD